MASEAPVSGAWINGKQADATVLRFLATSALGGGSGPVDIRSGVRPGVGSGAVTVPTSGMQVRVAPAVVAIQASAGGAYVLAWTSAVDLDVDDADSQSRVDAVVARVLDTGTSSSQYKLQVLKGTAGSGAAPATPSNALFLKNITVPANAATLNNGNLSGTAKPLVPLPALMAVAGASDYPPHPTGGGLLVMDASKSAGYLSYAGTWQEVFRLASPAATADSKVVGDRNDGTITVNTNATDSATEWLNKTGAPSVQLRVGPAGKVIVTISCEAHNDTDGKSSRMSYKASGANNLDSTFSRSASCLSNRATTVSRTTYLDGLNPGLTTFTCQFYASGDLATFDDMSIVVEAL